MKTKQLIWSTLIVTAGTIASMSGPCPPSLVANAEPSATDTMQVRASIETVTWLSDVDAAVAEATAQGKMVLIDVGAPWCHWCKQMEEVTFMDQSVVKALNQKFVCVRLNSDDGGAGSQFAQQMKIEALPTIVVFDPKANQFTTRSGYMNPQDFVAMLSDVEKQFVAIVQ